MNNTKDLTRVVLYGTFDGFTYSTDDLPKTVVILDGGESVEIPNGCVISADQIVKKDEIKLRDVIKRIKDLDIGTRKVWLDEFLNELGSDYGTLKYKDGYEQGKVEGLIECEKPVVPQFVADYIDISKFYIRTLHYALEDSPEKVNLWLCEDEKNRQEIFARAWLDGYEVEKEKQYEVLLCNGQSLKTVYRQGNDRLDFEKVYGDLERFTRRQLEDAGLGWVFDCPGIEIEEVE